MNKDAFKQAIARQSRAWTEASHRYHRRSRKDKNLLSEAASEQKEALQDLVHTFEQMDENPCASCGRCCSTAALNSGYFSHTEREVLLHKGVNIFDYVVPDWGEQEEPLFRCLFLTPKGCNIPAEHRSLTCTVYACYDKLGPQLEQEGLQESYHVNANRLKRAHKKTDGLSTIPFEREINISFGEDRQVAESSLPSSG